MSGEVEKTRYGENLRLHELTTNLRACPRLHSSPAMASHGDGSGSTGRGRVLPALAPRFASFARPGLRVKGFASPLVRRETEESEGRFPETRAP